MVKIVKFGQICEIFGRILKLDWNCQFGYGLVFSGMVWLKLWSWIWFGMVWCGLVQIVKLNSQPWMNEWITKVGIELLGQLKKSIYELSVTKYSPKSPYNSFPSICCSYLWICLSKISCSNLYIDIFVLTTRAVCASLGLSQIVAINW